MKYLSFFLLISISAFFRAIAQDRKCEFVFYVGGLPDYDEKTDIIVDRINREWGICYYYTGCISETEIADSLNILNRKTAIVIANKYGKDWEDRISTQIQFALDNFYDDTLIYSSELVAGCMRYPQYYYSDRRKMDYWFDRQISTGCEPSSLCLVNVFDSNSTVLYKGVDNTFRFPLIKDRELYHFHCVGCDISSFDFISCDTIELVLRATEKEPSIRVVFDEVDTLVFSFSTKLLLNPQLYLDCFVDSVPLKSLRHIKQLICRYPDNITLKKEFTVLKWEVVSNNPKFCFYTQTDPTIPRKIFRNIEKGDSIIFMCSVKGPDGIIRKKSGEFIVK